MKQIRFPFPMRGGKHRCFPGWIGAAVTVLVLVLPQASTRARAQAPPDGAVNGLTPKFINVAGIRTRYYEMGTGEPLILIHGGGGTSPNSANIWSENIRPLSKHFHVIAPDRLGCGLTAGTFAQSENYQDQADWLYNFLHAMHLNQVNLVGHSAGGAVVSWFAVEHPDMIKTLVVMSAGPETPGIHRPTKMIEEMKSCPTEPLFASQKCRLSLLSYDPKHTFNAHFWDVQLQMKDWRDQHYKIPNASPLQLGAPNPQFESQLHSMWEKARDGVLGQKPVLIVYGKQDPFDWAADAPNSDLHGAISFFDILGAKDANVQMIVINDAGHFVFRDQPAEFNSDLIGFLDHWSQNANN